MTTFPELCLCGHDDTDHVRRAGRCRGRDSYGQRCECPSIDPWTDDDLDDCARKPDTY